MQTYLRGTRHESMSRHACYYSSSIGGLSLLPLTDSRLMSSTWKRTPILLQIHEMSFEIPFAEVPFHQSRMPPGWRSTKEHDAHSWSVLHIMNVPIIHNFQKRWEWMTTNTFLFWFLFLFITTDIEIHEQEEIGTNNSNTRIGSQACSITRLRDSVQLKWTVHTHRETHHKLEDLKQCQVFLPPHVKMPRRK